MILIGKKTQHGFVLVNEELEMVQEIHTQQTIHSGSGPQIHDADAPLASAAVGFVACRQQYGFSITRRPVSLDLCFHLGCWAETGCPSNCQ